MEQALSIIGMLFSGQNPIIVITIVIAVVVASVFIGMIEGLFFSLWAVSGVFWGISKIAWNKFSTSDQTLLFSIGYVIIFAITISTTIAILRAVRRAGIFAIKKIRKASNRVMYRESTNCQTNITNIG